MCAENNAVDFDDLLGLTVALLQQVPSVRQMLQDAWRHVLVDEFQVCRQGGAGGLEGGRVSDQVKVREGRGGGRGGSERR